MYKVYIRASSLSSLPDDLANMEKFIGGIIFDQNDSIPEHKLANIPIYRLENGEIINSENHIIGKKILIDSPQAMQGALEDTEKYEMLVVKTSDWKIIPLENLIAKYDGSSVSIVAIANTVEDIELLSGILEIGVGGIIISPNSAEEWELFIAKITGQQSNTTLTSLEILSVEAIGMGDRVCVDTVSILYPGEGMLVGSTSQLFVLVEAEVHSYGYVNPRPFRVNAGVISLYTLNDERTNYLSELAAGSEVSIVNREGSIRKEKVARVKIERRPMLLLKIKVNEKSYPVVLQDAETVRVMTEDGSVPIGEVKPGLKVLCHISSSARHFGMKVDEFVEER